jgi:F-type H+-transporting ATPase subunit epsilon
MASSFLLRVITPSREAVNQHVDMVTAPGTVGEFGILPDHAAFLSSLEIGCLTYAAESGSGKIAIRDGFAEVGDNVMTVLAADTAESGEVDSAEAEAELRRAQKQLADLSPVDPGYDEIDADRRWAEARLALLKK